MNNILRDRELRDLIDEILAASDGLDTVMSGVTSLECRERQAIWRVHEAMMAAAVCLAQIRNERLYGVSA